jgi:hypothetical protein
LLNALTDALDEVHRVKHWYICSINKFTGKAVVLKKVEQLTPKKDPSEESDHASGMDPDDEDI